MQSDEPGHKPMSWKPRPGLNYTIVIHLLDEASSRNIQLVPLIYNYLAPVLRQAFGTAFALLTHGRGYI